VLKIGGDLNPERILFVFIVFSYYILKRKGVLNTKKTNNAEKLMVLFVLICLYSIYTVKATTFNENFGRLMYLVYVGIYPYFIYFYFRRLPYNAENLKTFMKIIMMMGVYLLYVGALEHFRIWNYVWPEYIADRSVGTQFGRTRGPFVQSATMGKALIVSFSFMVFLASETIGLIKITYIVLSLQSMVVIYFTYTRGPWVGTAIVIFVMFFFKTDLKKVSRFVVLMLMLGMVVGIGTKLSFFGGKSLFSQRQDTVSNRVVTWITSVEMIKDKPLLGIGWGLFKEKWDMYFVDNYSDDWGAFDGSHNLYLSILAEVGIVGGGACIMAFILLGVECLRVYSKLDHFRSFEKKFVVITIGILCMHMFTSFFSDPRNAPYQNTVLFVCLGIVSSIGSNFEKDKIDDKT
jgi:putative inorganic carbon (HCO3(-)) transporter